LITDQRDNRHEVEEWNTPEYEITMRRESLLILFFASAFALGGVMGTVYRVTLLWIGRAF
jgi:hypothetical protein